MLTRILGLASLLAITASMVHGTTLAAKATDWKARPVRVATEGAFRPWNFVEGGKLQGFDIEFLADLCGRAGLTCESVIQDWDGMIPALNAGKFDAILAAMSITDKRKEVVDFSIPYGSNYHKFAVRNDGPLTHLPGAGITMTQEKDPTAFKSFIDEMRQAVEGKTLGAQTATPHLAFLKKYFGDIATIREYKSTEQHDLDLLAGRIDLIFGADTPIASTVDRDGGKELVIVGPRVTESDVFGPGAGIAFRKNDSDLRIIFDKAISEAIADGTVRRLSLKWTKQDVTPGQ